MEKLTIKSWALDDRPREKLLAKGKTALSDAELIAILIGSGNRQESAVALSKRILQSVDGNINELAKLSVEKLSTFKGIGEAKAISIITALELGKRRQLETALEKPKITSSKAVFDLMQPIIGDLEHEEFWVLFLNNSNKVLAKTQISKGGLTATVVDVKIILQKAIEKLASGIILCHNHPSENKQASADDLKITTKIKEAAKLIDINVLDHIIVCGNSYISLADKNKM